LKLLNTADGAEHQVLKLLNTADGADVLFWDPGRSNECHDI